jgi:hypothetical protein
MSPFARGRLCGAFGYPPGYTTEPLRSHGRPLRRRVQLSWREIVRLVGFGDLSAQQGVPIHAQFGGAMAISHGSAPELFGTRWRQKLLGSALNHPAVQGNKV